MRLKVGLASTAPIALSAAGAEARSGGLVKIGVLNDVSSLYAGLGGKGPVVVAEITGLADAGGDTVNSIRQGAEFGITAFRPLDQGDCPLVTKS